MDKLTIYVNWGPLDHASHYMCVRTYLVLRRNVWQSVCVYLYLVALNEQHISHHLE